MTKVKNLCRMCEINPTCNVDNTPALFEKMCGDCYMKWAWMTIKVDTHEGWKLPEEFPKSIMTKEQNQIIYDELMEDVGLDEEKVIKGSKDE